MLRKLPFSNLGFVDFVLCEVSFSCNRFHFCVFGLAEGTVSVSDWVVMFWVYFFFLHALIL